MRKPFRRRKDGMDMTNKASGPKRNGRLVSDSGSTVSLDHAHADDRRRLLELLDHLCGNGAIGINESVGEVAAALVGDGRQCGTDSRTA